MTSSAKRRCGASGPVSRNRPGVRPCWSGCTRICTDRRSLSRRWRGSSSASSSSARESPGSGTSRGGAALPHCGGCSRRRCGRPWQGSMSGATCSRRCRRSFRQMVDAGAGPVSRGPDAAVGLPAVGAGRSHADGPFRRGPLPVPGSPRGRARRVAASPATSCACWTRSTCSSARRAASSRRRSWQRKKQPYRAPDALSFAEPGSRVDRRGRRARRRSREAGVFAPPPARQLIAKCRAQAADAASSRMPTTWRSSASFPRSWFTTSSFASARRPTRTSLYEPSWIAWRMLV